MAQQKLPKFTLSYNKKNDNWDLTNQKKEVVKSFENKSDATAGGQLEKAIGGAGSVRIKKMDGEYQEERTFPRSADPKKSKG